MSSIGLRRNKPRTIVLSKFSSTSSLNILLALLDGQECDRATLVGQTSLGSWLEFPVLTAVAAASKLLLPIVA